LESNLICESVAAFYSSRNIPISTTRFNASSEKEQL